MTYPAFLDNQQIEELETMGYLEATEQLLDDLLSWCRDEDQELEEYCLESVYGPEE